MYERDLVIAMVAELGVVRRTHLSLRGVEHATARPSA